MPQILSSILWKMEACKRHIPEEHEAVVQMTTRNLGEIWISLGTPVIALQVCVCFRVTVLNE
ncbi:hypothetical protein BJ165DRAFT_1616729 [Panaeolus papilionaceus]|nr:hypothetical protein BJ165DRAFT_1616729 [Panaeolus papilionaceus]